MSVSERGGVDFIGNYSCNSHQRAALKQLGQMVVEPVVDWELYKVMKPHYPWLDPAKENRSVTDPEWWSKGISKFGCPIHATKVGVQGQWEHRFLGVHGSGNCSCGRKQKQQRDESERNSRARRVDGRFSQSRTTTSAGALSGDGRTSVSVHSRADRRSAENPAWRREHEVAYLDALHATFSTVVHPTRRVRPLSVDEVVENHLHMSHYAGAPYFCSVERALPRAMGHARSIMDGKRSFDPYLSLRRVQFGDGEPKTRLVWGAPLATTILAARFSKVLHPLLERRRPFAWGVDGIERGTFVSELSRFDVTYSIDFSGFDSSLSARIIRDCFEILESMIDMDVDEKSLWDKLVGDFIHSKLLTTTGEVYRVHKGVPSGSMFTSMIDSIANLLIMNYTFIRLTGKSLKPDQLWILGDDTYVGVNHNISVKRISSVSRELGVVVSDSKTSVKRHFRAEEDPVEGEKRPHFLGKEWVNSQAHRPHRDIVLRMVFPERHAYRPRSLSYIRFLAYAADSTEWWDIARKIFPGTSPLDTIWKIMREIDLELEVDVRDLPGQLRLLKLVHGKDLPYNIGRKGMKPALVGRFA